MERQRTLPKSATPYSNAPSSERSESTMDHAGEDMINGDEDVQPFETGRLVLATTGNLHLSPSATFYHPAYALVEHQQIASDPPHAPLAGNLAPFLPFAMTAHDHRLLLDLAFDRQLDFGVNPFKEEFLAAMNKDPHARAWYYSPLLHLSVLGIGWRYCIDRDMFRMYHSGDDFEQRGVSFADKARDLLLAEAKAPLLSTILALICQTIFNVGMVNDSVAGGCIMMASFHAMDFRLHRRCDGQLVSIGAEVGSGLDASRRNVWGYIHNFSVWWATYFAQPVLPVNEFSDQRPPPTINEPNTRVGKISMMAARHNGLSSLGLETLRICHMTQMPMQNRILEVWRIYRKLKEWRNGLPREITWPPSSELLMDPANLATHGMYCTYVIILFRPYIIKVRDSQNCIPEALHICIQAAQEIVDQCRYLVANHGAQCGPVTIQHIIYVCSTMLILQVSGLSTVSDSAKTTAIQSLDFLRGILNSFAQVWPAAARTAQSLGQLQEDCLTVNNTNDC